MALLCLKTVILSSKVRLRKPDPAIYLLASRCIGSAPENCAYVGDNPVRDVEGGPRQAGQPRRVWRNPLRRIVRQQVLQP